MKSHILCAVIAAATLTLPLAANAQNIPEGIAHGGSVGMNTAGPIGAVVGGAVGGVLGGVEGLFGIRPVSYSEGQPHRVHRHGVGHADRHPHHKATPS